MTADVLCGILVRLCLGVIWGHISVWRKEKLSGVCVLLLHCWFCFKLQVTLERSGEQLIPNTVNSLQNKSGIPEREREQKRKLKGEYIILLNQR